MSRINNSWQLVKASWSVLLADKELVIFPIISFFASMIVVATFFLPMLFAGVFDAIFAGGMQVVGFVVGFAFYIFLYFVTFFFNSALVGAAMIRLEGGDPTVGDGLRIAFQHISSIFGYAVIAATVGMILRAISERAGFLGRIVVGLIGFAWNVATFLVVPTLVVEGVGPVDGVKRSAALLKKTWGEQLVGNFSIGLIFGLVIFGVILVSSALIVMAAIANLIWLVVALVLLDVMVLIVLGLISSSLNGIFTAAVYQYATTGESKYFDPDMVKNTFKQKR
ncbi:MAG: hypothetical protein KA362_07815 [Chloroflexi bacterium]|nr:hypothetical protein [Chloroflexota bacterium]MBK7176633.1 hypothetical protein [Chloroflexota bacterium]MBP6804000.1 hypothetical protein [Chloroflexota bacterium]MBP7593180.1 hypothetical protein [Chloroflexota bacterium]